MGTVCRGVRLHFCYPKCFAFHIILIVTLVKKSQQQLSYCMKGVQNLPKFAKICQTFRIKTSRTISFNFVRFLSVGTLKHLKSINVCCALLLKSNHTDLWSGLFHLHFQDFKNTAFLPFAIFMSLHLNVSPLHLHVR